MQRQQRLGRWATHFYQYELYFPLSSSWSFLSVLHQAPSLYNILRGEMSFIGPRPVSPNETLTKERTAWKRYDIRPGLLSLWWIRRRANIAYTSEVGLDLEYVETNTMKGDLGIAIRSIPAVFLSGAPSSAPSELNFLGVRIDNLTMMDASSKIIRLAKEDAASQVCFINADCVNLAFENHLYSETLAHATMVLADGIGIRVAGSILNQNVRENVNGTDMLPFLCAAAEQAQLSLYLLGGRPGVAELAAERISESYPELRIAGVHHGYFSPEEQPQRA